MKVARFMVAGTGPVGKTEWERSTLARPILLQQAVSSSIEPESRMPAEGITARPPAAKLSAWLRCCSMRCTNFIKANDAFKLLLVSPTYADGWWVNEVGEGEWNCAGAVLPDSNNRTRRFSTRALDACPRQGVAYIRDAGR